MGRCSRNRLRNGFRAWSKHNDKSKNSFAHEWKISSTFDKIATVIIYLFLFILACGWLTGNFHF